MFQESDIGLVRIMLYSICGNNYMDRFNELKAESIQIFGEVGVGAYNTWNDLNAKFFYVRNTLGPI